VVVRKVTVHLDDDQAERLARLVREEGRSRSAVLRSAFAASLHATSDDRRFAVAGMGHGDGTSIADVSEAESLEGFGG
jgi:predicted transcriptional regulator